MNRKIEFRAKRINNGEWVYGYLTKREYKLKSAWFDRYFIDGHHVEVATIGQFTGLLGRNRQRIFEGDIIKIAAGWSYGNQYVVKWITQECGFLLVSDMNYAPWIKYTLSNLEIIGNIHDNPELIGGGKWQ